MRLRDIAEYHDPDYFFPAGIAFIYTGSHFLYDEEGMTHADLIAQNSGIFNLQVEYHPDEYGDEYQADLDAAADVERERLETYALVGRTDDVWEADQISFWNNHNQLHGLLEDCFQKMLDEGFITPTTIVNISGQPNFKVSEVDIVKFQTLNPEKEEELRLRRELHTMRPQAKKKAFKKLGLKWGGNKQAWQQAAEKAGLVQPGQKWWAMKSEGIAQK